MTKLNNIELKELAESMGAFENGKIPGAMAIETTDEIAKRAFPRSAFLQFLASKGRISPADAYQVVFFKETRNNPAQYIGETEDVPEGNANSYTPVTRVMRTVISSFVLSKMAQLGTASTFDLKQREIEEGYIEIQNKIDDGLLNGVTVDGETFVNSVIEDVPETEAGGVLTEDIMDNFLNTIVTNNGGHPDALITDFKVAQQLKKLVAPYRRINDTVEITAGFNVTTYQSPDGTLIPIIVDENIGKGGTAEAPTHQIFAVDSSAIEVKELMSASIFEVPTSKLANHYAIASFITALNIAPYRCGVLTGIAEPAEDEGGQVTP